MSTPTEDTDGGSLQAIMDQLPQTEYGKQEKWSNGKVTFEMFPEGYIALNKELATGLHPKLEEHLRQFPADEVDIRLARIAAYCEVMLDATYTIEERDRLCFVLAGRLEALRETPTGIIVQ